MTTSCSIIPLENATEVDIAQLIEIAQDREVMKWIGTGEPWTAEYIRGLVQSSRDDSRSSEQIARTYWSWIIYSDRVVGFVSLRPTRQRAFADGPQFRFFVAREYQRKGYGTCALLEVIAQIRSHPAARSRISAIYSFIDEENKASIATTRKVGFTRPRGSNFVIINSHRFVVLRYLLR